MNDEPLIGLMAICLLACVAALLAGAWVLVAVLGLAAAGSLARSRVHQNAMSRPPRPVITYLERSSPHEPLIRLERGQTATVPWPHTLQVIIPAGLSLKILEATPERVRVIAV